MDSKHQKNDSDIGAMLSSGSLFCWFIASDIFGTISGSAVANVASTGTFTIPMMKRTGYRGVFIMVDVEAIKNDLHGMDEKDIPALIPVLRRSTKLIIPVLVLIVTLVVFNITPCAAPPMPWRGG